MGSVQHPKMATAWVGRISQLLSGILRAERKPVVDTLIGTGSDQPAPADAAAPAKSVRLVEIEPRQDKRPGSRSTSPTPRAPSAAAPQAGASQKSPLPRSARSPSGSRPSSPSAALAQLLAVAAATGATSTSPGLQSFSLNDERAPRDVPFEREFFGAPPANFRWPFFRAVAFYEHHGSFREAWPFASCSVADRPTDVAPSEGKYHFVMDVAEFLLVYPHPIECQTNHVDCTFLTFANHSNWWRFVLDGSMLARADEFLLMLYIGRHAGNENPPGALEHIVGPPSTCTTTFEHGARGTTATTFFKTIHWWQRDLSEVAPSFPVPSELQRSRPSHADSEVAMVVRSSLPPAFAAAHVAIWRHDLHSDPPSSPAASCVAPGYAAHRARMVCNFAAFAARFAPQLSAAQLSASERPRMLIAVQIGFFGGLVALVPTRSACFAATYVSGVPLLKQIQELAAYLPCHEEPQEMHITRDTFGDLVFALPCVFPIVTAADALPQPEDRGVHARWVLAGGLSHAQYSHTALALERCRSFTQAVPWLAARIGTMEGPRPVTPRRLAAPFRGGAASAEAQSAWDAFICAEAARHSEIVAAFEAADAGSGLLEAFICNISTAASRARELVMPPQGLP